MSLLEHSTEDQMLIHAQAAHARYGGLFACPIRYAMEVLRRKWAIQIIQALYLNQEPVRFNRLERALAPITQKELSKRLRELEQAGVLTRTVYPEVPPRVEYQLSEGGRALMPILAALTDWVEVYTSEAVGQRELL